MTLHTPPANIYGLLASFVSPEALVRAAHRATENGYTQVDAYSPFPLDELSDALGFRKTRLPWFVFVAGVIGACVGYGLQYYCTVIAYPLNIGGRPLHSWPAFIPVTFETTILFASLAAVLGTLVFNRLPQPYHPLFNVPEFSLASRDRFFLCIEATDPRFDPDACYAFLESLEPLKIDWVDP